MQKCVTFSPDSPLSPETLCLTGRCLMLVTDGAYDSLPITRSIEEGFAGTRVVRFSDFKPNPTYGSVEEGVRIFRSEGCDGILAIGGGSAIDVAKCISIYENLDPSRNFLEQEIVGRRVPFAAIPTTAGTGSEATRFAVIYLNGEKQSVTHTSCIPDVVGFCPKVLQTLPPYQKKATMLDALCHAIESMWSVFATEESRTLAEDAICRIIKNYRRYLCGDESVFEEMFIAAYIAGKAINLTQTTAGHAMSYKITSLYHIAHGHAVALCLAALLPYAYRHPDRSVLAGGADELLHILERISEICGSQNIEEGTHVLSVLLKELGMEAPKLRKEDLGLLADSVNPVRLKNNPFRLEREDFIELYQQILS